MSAVNSVLPVDTVHSIDEMSCRLTGRQTVRDNAVEIGRAVKKAIREQVGEYVKCSVGIAPNRFLAKVASDMEKPDGFTVITKEDLPQKLYSLSLTDLPGIGRRMHKRLKLHGVRYGRGAVRIIRERDHGRLAECLGEAFQAYAQGRGCNRSLKPGGRPWVIPMCLRLSSRTDEGARAVFVRLIDKAAFRLRRLGYLAGKMVVRIDYLGGETSWKVSADVLVRNDTQTMIEAFSSIWEKRPRRRKPLRASVIFTDLIPARETSFSLLCRGEEA